MKLHHSLMNYNETNDNLLIIANRNMATIQEDPSSCHWGSHSLWGSHNLWGTFEILYNFKVNNTNAYECEFCQFYQHWEMYFFAYVSKYVILKIIFRTQLKFAISFSYHPLFLWDGIFNKLLPVSTLLLSINIVQ